MESGGWHRIGVIVTINITADPAKKIEGSHEDGEMRK